MDYDIVSSLGEVKYKNTNVVHRESVSDLIVEK